MNGTYGSITIAADGSYTYAVENTNSAVQALRTTANTLTDVFTYTMRDAAGLLSTNQITITIQGTNDAPVGVNDSATAIEAGGTANGTAGTNPTGNVLTNDTDVDAGDTRTVNGVVAGPSASAVGSVGTSVTGSYGAITINADGSYSYTVDNSNATVQALRISGQTILDVFTYQVADTGGLTSVATITVTIQGANDAPVGVNDTATAVEAGGTANGTAGTNPTGNVLTNDTDVDAGDIKTVSGVVAGPSASAVGSVGASVGGSYGSITINSDGSYTYAVDNTNTAVQALRISGQTLQDVFTYKVSDTDGSTSLATITVTIQGANDAPTAIVDTVTAVEAGGSNNALYSVNPSGNVLTNDTDPDSNANGETKLVTGVVGGIAASASGFVNTNVNGLYGSITIAADGSYTYVVNNNNATVQALRNSSNTLMDVFTYTMTDAAGSTSSQQISVTIQGSNDTPIAVSDGAIAVEAGGVGNSTVGSNGTGNVLANDTDVDSAAFGETKTVNGVVAGVAGTASGNVGSAVLGLYGSITLAADGSYSYAVNDSNSAVQALANSSQTLNDIFTYRMVDSSGHTSVTQLTITIQGANDTPTITSDGGGVTAAIAMSENIAAVTTVVGDDVDAGTTLTYTIIGGADAAKFTITAGGSLAFVTAPDFEFPTDVGGNNVYDVIVEVSDGLLATTQALAVTITDVSNFLMVTTDADINDSGIAAGAAFNIEWLNANRGADALVSLREAIIAANNTSGTDTVNFSITGTGVKTINLASALPAISDTIVINGYSQNGASANTLAIGNNAVLNIVLNGSGAGVGPMVYRLLLVLRAARSAAWSSRTSRSTVSLYRAAVIRSVETSSA